MRTTLTIDPDVAHMLEEEVHRERKPMKQVVNEALRRGLSPRLSGKKLPPYRVTLSIGGLQPGVDPARLNQLADEFEVEEYLRIAREQSSPK
jgi:hypothetical protein